MTTTIKIRGALPSSGEPICRTCRYAHIQRGFRESEEAIYCDYSFSALRKVPFKVADCTDYADRSVPARWELEKIALIINVEPTRRLIGFDRGIGFAPDADDSEDTVSTME